MTHTAKHTPGPWVVTEHSSGMICVAGPDHKDLCAVGYNKTEGRDDAANATLIAAAPAMYEALAKLRLEAIHYRNTGVGVQFLNHAIDQAELAINQVWGEGESNYDTEREG